MSNAQVWRAAQERLRREMTPAQFETWLRGTSLHAASDGATVLNVRTTFAKEMLESRFFERIQAAVAQVTGQTCRLRITVAPVTIDGSADAGSADDGAEPIMATSASPRATARARAHGNHPGEVAYVRPSLFALPADEPPMREEPPAREALTPRPGASGTAGEPRRYQRARHTALGGARERIAQASAGTPTAAPKRARVRAAIALARSCGRVVAVTKETPARAVASRGSGAKNAAATHGAAGDTTMATGGYDEARGELRAKRGQHVAAQEVSATEQPGPAPLFPREPPANGDAGGVVVPPPRLNPRYTFATFIVGSANQLAHAASLAIADAPGQAYNPLFLYGGVGLGKTHLLHAIGHTAIERGLSVLYVSSETFTNEIINAIRFRTTEEFRAKYRSVDVLLVDDIQFIAGKDSTEEEFFHTFNSLYEMSKQIVICSDRPPKAIVSLEERLRSRFAWGLTADIQPPDLETRVAILRAKADLLQRRVPDDVITYLASSVRSNIRELEGSLNRLLAIAQLQGKPLTIETAKSAISNLALDGNQKRVSTGDVLAAVAEYYRISADDLQGKQRDKHIVVPRQVAMYLMRQETEASLLEIGQALGGRDHSTILHGCEKIGREMTENTALRKEVLAIRQQLFG